MNYDFDNLNSHGNGSFFDTGTTFLYLPPDLISMFKSGFNNHCSKSPANCAHHDKYRECYYWDKSRYANLNDFFKTFPIMTFYFNGNIPYKWHPQDYLVLPLDSNTHYCIGVKTLSHTILGAIFMRNYDIYFDRTNKKISFTRANCGSDPYFIDSLFKKPDDKPLMQKSNLKTQTVHATPVSSETAHGKSIKKTPVYKKKAKGIENDNSSFKILVILLILLSGIFGSIILLRYLWKQKTDGKNVESEINTRLDLRES